MKLNKEFLRTFTLPIAVLAGIFVYLLLGYLNVDTIPTIVILATIILGSYELFIETYQELMKKHFALDYLAILAIIVSLITGEYIVGAIIALMITSGRTLEDYGVSQAKKSLTNLIDRIPATVTLLQKGKQEKKSIKQIKLHDHILIRTGEVIPLDGMLHTSEGLVDESSLTGEPYPVEKRAGDSIRSGTVNMGNPLEITVTRTEENSTYHKIITMVQNAQDEKAPMVRLADKYSTYFTAISLLIAGVGYMLSSDLNRVLAVLVIATPCPLLLATPIALLGGVNASAKKRIIVKRLAALEALSRVNTIVFDKTGTITIGKPTVSSFTIHTKSYSEKDVLSIAEAIERNSLHPLAKAIVSFAKEKKVPQKVATDIKETIGKGISGTITKKTYTLSKIEKSEGMHIGLFEKDTLLATFIFSDEIKQDAKKIIEKLTEKNMQLSIFTGDKKQAAEKIAHILGSHVTVKADLSPEDKKNGILTLKKEGKVIAMIGDGINDAPALALADVGMVFSNEEQTASSEAADIVFLGGDFTQVHQAHNIAKHTISVAISSILIGIGIAIVGMGFAAFGFIPPLIGAVMQEAIDVFSILNALRASKST